MRTDQSDIPYAAAPRLASCAVTAGGYAASGSAGIQIASGWECRQIGEAPEAETLVGVNAVRVVAVLVDQRHRRRKLKGWALQVESTPFACAYVLVAAIADKGCRDEVGGARASKIVQRLEDVVVAEV